MHGETVKIKKILATAFDMIISPCTFIYNLSNDTNTHTKLRSNSE